MLSSLNELQNIVCFDKVPVRRYRRLCNSEESKPMNNWLAEELMHILKCGGIATLCIIGHVITALYLNINPLFKKYINNMKSLNIQNSNSYLNELWAKSGPITN